METVRETYVPHIGVGISREFLGRAAAQNRGGLGGLLALSDAVRDGEVSTSAAAARKKSYVIRH
jgi:hypothetical protein